MSVIHKLKTYIPKPVQSSLKPLYRSVRYSFLGKWWVDHLLYRRLKKNYLCDAHRYLKYAVLGKCDLVQSSLRARIIIHAHCIEKGLSHPAPCLHFGQQRIDRLLEDLFEYIPKHGYDMAVNMGLGVLNEYSEFHRQRGGQIDILESSLKNPVLRQYEEKCRGKIGGSISVTKDEIQSCGKMDIEPFLKSRHSIRHFDARPVEDELIRRAVSLAITTPSVCNRQMWKVRSFRENPRKQTILDLQNGNRGFQEEIDTVLLVTCDLQSFFSVEERNEAWIDGGMFSMMLLLALHSVGLGACCLNWCASQKKDRELRELIGLPEAEVVIVVIAVGHIPDRLSVACSVRKQLDEVLFFEN